VLCSAAVAPGTARGSHFTALDGLRGLAALLVVFMHLPERMGLDLAARQHSWLFRFSLAGDMGVDLFFVLSGFLITTILLENVRRPFGLRTFWVRRVLRIFPLYYLYLAVLLLVVNLTPWFAGEQVPQRWSTWLGYWLFLSNFTLLLSGRSALEFIVTWSLAVEEQFYALWPLIVRRHSQRELMKVSLAMMLLAPLLRLATALISPGLDTFYLLPFCRADALFAGAALALARRDATLRAAVCRISRFAIYPALALLLFLLQQPTYHDDPKGPLWVTVYYSALAQSWAVVVWSALEPSRLGRLLLENRALTYVGRISYGLYLWHPLALRLIERANRGWRLGAAPLLVTNLAVSLLVATLSFTLFERPILNFKERFRYGA
jgi:peptidoglycan/LPS O-acetylase OafA/YrhL